MTAATRADAGPAGGPAAFYCLCNHWTQGGIGLAFPEGWFGGRHYRQTFSTAYGVAKMIEATEQYPGLVACMELDAFAYEALAEEDPALLERLREAVRRGVVGIEGGTYGQPFGQDYGWESNVRQLTLGRRTIAEVLGVDLPVFLVEEQWFHPQLPQLLLGAGFRYASLQNQNSGQVRVPRASLLRWRGLDGSVIPTLPPNDLVLTCVRQYMDYEEYRERLADFDPPPLLFQWVEIWPPGYDWGASCTPFDAGIRQVLAGLARPTTLAGYFAAIDPSSAPEHSIPLDDSRYGNDWYQGGGWGYDGERVIVADHRAEAALLQAEGLSALAALRGATPDLPALLRLWKRLLIAQNHDFSVARNYVVYHDRLRTTAGDLALAWYAALEAEAEQIAARASETLAGRAEASPPATLACYRAAGIAGEQPVEVVVDLPAPGVRGLALAQAGRAIPLQPLALERHPDGSLARARLLCRPRLPALGLAGLEVRAGEGPALADPPPAGPPLLDDGQVRVAWDAVERVARVQDSASGIVLSILPLAGPIGRTQEHSGGMALGAAHKRFAFSFGGPSRTPNETPTLVAEVVERGPLRSTLRLRGEVVNLSTTDTPAVFVEHEFTLHHGLGRVDLRTYLSAGIPIWVQARAVFIHNLAGASYARDFPWGEEVAAVDDIYPLSYLRVVSGGRAFTLAHGGTARMTLRREPGGGVIENLVARDVVRGEYEWRWAIRLGHPDLPWESLGFARAAFAPVRVQPAGAPPPALRVEPADPRLVVSALWPEENRAVGLRVVNYSAEPLARAVLWVGWPVGAAERTDLQGKVVGAAEWRPSGDGAEILLDLAPWQIATLRLAAPLPRGRGTAGARESATRTARSLR